MAREISNDRYGIFGRLSRSALWATAIFLAAGPLASAEDQSVPIAPERIAGAVKLGMPLAEKAASNYPEHRKCFSCHHQTLPMLSMVSARHAGNQVDEKVF